MNSVSVVFAVLLSSFLIFPSAGIAQDRKLIESSVSGSTALGRAHKLTGISITYEGSPELSAALRTRLIEKGWKIVDATENAPARIIVAPLFSGKATERPLMGGEGQDKPSLSIFDIGAALLSVGQLATSLPQAVSSGGSTASHLISNTLATTATANLIQTAEKTGAFKRTKKPQDAYMVSIEIEGPGGQRQSGQVLSESYAENVPPGLLIRDNLDMVVWFIE